MSVIEKHNDTINKLYEKLYLALRRIYRENSGYKISNELLNEIKFEDSELIDALVDDLNCEILPKKIKNNKISKDNAFLIGKSIHYGNWNHTLFIKKRIISLVINASLYHNFIENSCSEFINR